MALHSQVTAAQDANDSLQQDGAPEMEGASSAPVCSLGASAAAIQSSRPATPPRPLRVYSRRKGGSASRRSTTQQAGATPPSTLAAPQRQFISRISKAVGTLLPVPKIDKRRKKTVPSDSPPRRSRRIAGLGMEPAQAALPRAKRTVMQSLGINNPQERLQQEDQEKYAKLFTQLLSAFHIQALASLFGWAVTDMEGQSAASPTVV